MTTQPKAIVLVVLCTVIVTAAQLLMKLGLNTGKPLTGLLVDPYLVLGIGLMFIGGFLLTFALKHGELSVVHPILSLGFVWVVLTSGFIGETVTGLQYAGVASIVLGVSAISQSRRRT